MAERGEVKRPPWDGPGEDMRYLVIGGWTVTGPAKSGPRGNRVVARHDPCGRAAACYVRDLRSKAERCPCEVPVERPTLRLVPGRRT